MLKHTLESAGQWSSGLFPLGQHQTPLAGAFWPADPSAAPGTHTHTQRVMWNGTVYGAMAGICNICTFAATNLIITTSSRPSLWSHERTKNPALCFYTAKDQKNGGNDSQWVCGHTSLSSPILRSALSWLWLRIACIRKKINIFEDTFTDKENK